MIFRDNAFAGWITADPSLAGPGGLRPGSQVPEGVMNTEIALGRELPVHGIVAVLGDDNRVARLHGGEMCQIA